MDLDANTPSDDSSTGVLEAVSQVAQVKNLCYIHRLKTGATLTGAILAGAIVTGATRWW